ncbi:hypothetical protein EPJ79_00965 [Brachyspira aalborgi]|uniref:PorT family protein n=1 Tax=Brachyspira aalborgi TaxID=29522 RepID=A0A5C8D2Q3_9SPIR|nr:hypothetical protein [Brachyspira aalborgi]TXJ19760.1 hypothetical protein EPJ79_00965 [Brachyspira aalborgi]
MRLKLKLIISLFILMYSKLLPVNFEFSFGGSLGSTIDFSQVVAYLDIAKPLEGSRVDYGFSANCFLDIGANFELQDSEVLKGVSILFETGYYYYMRYRTETENIDKKNKFKYHNLILGVLPKFNFNNGISFGIGAGIYLPFYSWIGRKIYSNTEASPLGLGIYGGLSKIDFKKIINMYKVPVMPYVKLNLEKNYYISELWAFKIGANMIYNFGMEFDTDNLRKNTTQYTFDEYKFSSLSFEVFFGFGFGRPK